MDSPKFISEPLFPECQKCNWRLMILVFIIVAFVIYFYSTSLYNKGEKDPLNYQFVEGGPNTRIDGWRITHFVFYTILGWFFPYCWKLAFFISIVWELIEMWMSKSREDWQGNVTDIFVNMFGFFFGRHMRVTFDNSPCLSS